MTTHVHGPALDHPEDAVDPLEGEPPVAPTFTRLRWLVPGLAIGIVAAALLVTGTVSFSTVLYAGLFGGMLLMHLGGHGMHGGHGAGGHGSHGGGGSPDGPAPSEPARVSEPDGSESALGARRKCRTMDAERKSGRRRTALTAATDIGDSARSTAAAVGRSRRVHPHH